MKIIGITSINGTKHIVLKGDSSLLNNRKPFFMPSGEDAVIEICAARCLVLRISRLGKSIPTRFAYRYYDAVAPGLNFWDEKQLTAGEWTRAFCFDYSLCVGTFTPYNGDSLPDLPLTKNCFPITENGLPLMGKTHGKGLDGLCLTPAEAIHEISNLMTIRQGDYIFIDYEGEIIHPIKNRIIEEEGLYCKIK